jgi:hypothetical protein
MVVEGQSVTDPVGAGLSADHDEDGGRRYLLVSSGVEAFQDQRSQAGVEAVLYPVDSAGWL